MEQWYYYEYARRASRNVDHHSGLMYLRSLARKAPSILDLGCGEGTRLNTLLPSLKTGSGVDINSYAIKQAKKQFPHHKFYLYDGQTLPFENNSFDLVYSAFVLEHTTDPTRFLSEAIRVLQPRGHLVLLCPNFGAPNRRSPNSKENPLLKLTRGLLADFLLPPSHQLNWTKVIPKKKYLNIDDDTTVEPYLRSLLNFLLSQKLQIVKQASLWELEPGSLSPRKLLFTILGKLNLFPFKYWGPQIFISARKNLK